MCYDTDIRSRTLQVPRNCLQCPFFVCQFKTFAAEEKARRLRIKAQRNTWVAAAGILAAGLALK